MFKKKLYINRNVSKIDIFSFTYVEKDSNLYNELENT